MDKRLNPNLLGCPMYRKLMPRKWEPHLLEAFFTLFIGAMDFGVIWLIESRTIRNDVDIAQNIGMYVILFFFTMMCIFLEVHSTRQSKQENIKRVERLAAIPEADFWDLVEAEVSMSEKQYGSFYLLTHYLYAPEKRLLIRYEHIETWKYADFFSPISGDLKNAFLDIVEKDGFKTQIIIRDRKKLLAEQDRFRLKLDFKIKQAKYPNGSPYRSSL